MSRQVVNKLNKTSEKSLQIFFRKIEDFVIGDFDSFKTKFLEVIYKDLRLLKDCSERSIVNFYEQCAKELLSDYPEINDDFWKILTSFMIELPFVLLSDIVFFIKFKPGLFYIVAIILISFLLIFESLGLFH